MILHMVGGVTGVIGAHFTLSQLLNGHSNQEIVDRKMPLAGFRLNLGSHNSENEVVSSTARGMRIGWKN